MKYWNERLTEDEHQAITDLAFDLTDLNLLTPETRRRIYNDLHGIIDDIYDNPLTPAIEAWAAQIELPKLSYKEMREMLEAAVTTTDTAFDTWCTITDAYEEMKSNEETK